MKGSKIRFSSATAKPKEASVYTVQTISINNLSGTIEKRTKYKFKCSRSGNVMPDRDICAECGKPLRRTFVCIRYFDDGEEEEKHYHFSCVRAKRIARR